MRDPAAFDPDKAPADPITLFRTWLSAAVDPQPRAMVLSTVDQSGHPDARVVMLRDVSADGWSFSSSALSPKGAQLAATPWAALTWYWPAQGRQVRAGGPVHAMDGTADFLARPPEGRAEAIVGRWQSRPLTDLAELRTALAEAAAHVDEVPRDWTRYLLRPTEVQFFQIDPTRAHARVRYDRTDEGWRRTALWP